MTIPRKIRLDLATPTEVAIRAAMAAVEGMGADVLLTKASRHLADALDAVSSYVDGQMRGVGLGEPLDFNAFNATHDENERHGKRQCRHCRHPASGHDRRTRACPYGDTTFWPVGEGAGQKTAQ
jgi:hypothetical protein